MVQVRVKRTGNISAKINQTKQEIAKKTKTQLTRDLRIFHQEILARTPVHTGRTVANYQWSINGPASGTITHSERAAMMPTNEMPLGMEPRRAENEDIADQSFSSMIQQLTDPYKKIFITNNVEYYEALEYGRPPPGKENARTPPGGIMRAASKLIRTKRSF